MSDTLVTQFKEIIKQIPYPESEEITPQAQEIYKQGNHILGNYRGDTRILLEALQIYVNCGCLPYALVGTGQVLMKAVYLIGTRSD